MLKILGATIQHSVAQVGFVYPCLRPWSEWRRHRPNSPDLYKPAGRHLLGLNTTDLVGRLQPMSEIGRIQFSLFFSADYDINHDGLRNIN